MRPLRLEIENVGSIPSLPIDFDDGVTAFAGPNGAGKSTVLNAIQAALFADGSRDLAGMLGPFGDRLSIALTFSHDGETYRVRRGYRVGAGGRASATLDLEIMHPLGAHDEAEYWHPLTWETTAATQERLEAILGLSRRTFRASAFLGQDDADAFTSASAPDRKAILGELLDPRGTYPALAKRAGEERRQAEREAASLEAKIADRQERVRERPGLETTALKLSGQELDARHLLHDSEQDLELAQTLQTASAEAVAQARAAAERKRTLEETATHAQVAADRLSADTDAVLQKKNALTDRAASFYDKMSDTCDRCGQELDDLSRRNLIASMGSEIATLHRQHAEKSAAALAAMQRADEARQAVKTLIVPPAPTEDYSRRVADSRTQVEQRRRALERVIAERAAVASRIEQLQTVEQELASLVIGHEQAKKTLDLVRLAERAFGRDGIPVLLVENVLPIIEAEANRILDLMPTAKGETFRVELRTQRENQSGTVRETLDVLVWDRNGPRVYESYSGGEKGRLNVALRLALAQLLASRRGAEARLLVLDEVPYLDALGQEQLVDVIRSVAPRFDVVLTVSHEERLADAFDRVIRLETDGNGVSRVAAEVEAVAA